MHIVHIVRKMKLLVPNLGFNSFYFLIVIICHNHILDKMAISYIHFPQDVIKKARLDKLLDEDRTMGTLDNTNND